MTKLVVLNAIGYINVEKKEKVYVKKKHVNIMKRLIQKHLGIRKQKNTVEMINDIFIKSIEEETFDTEVLSDMIYQKIMEE